MRTASCIVQVRNSDGAATPFSPDRFAGTLIRAGAAPAAALLAAASTHGILLGAGIAAVRTDTLRAAAGEILANPAFDACTLRRILVPAPSSDHQVAFSQREICLDAQPCERSDWGAVSVDYRAADQILYFNAAVDERWVVRNAPLFPSHDGHSVETLIYFDLGVKPGVKLTKLYAATSIAATPAAHAPFGYAMQPVEQHSEIYWTNFRDEPYPPLGAPPSAYGGAPLGRDQIVFCRRDYPNQPCGKNECGPTAVSNSLQWLNREYRLGIDPAKLTIDFWKAALGWGAGGVTHGQWADLKKRFVDDKKNKLPIDSTKESGGHARQVLDEFNGKGRSRTPQAIEVDIGSHVGAVTCIGGPDGDGHYHLVVASDIAQKGQNAAGDPQWQQVEITANGDVVSGPPWAQNQKVKNFVIQCPHPGKF